MLQEILGGGGIKPSFLIQVGEMLLAVPLSMFKLIYFPLGTMMGCRVR